MTNPFTNLFRARDKPRKRVKDSVSSALSFLFGNSNAGKNVSVETAMQVSAVYACVRVIAETVASLPVNVYEVTDKGSQKALDHPYYRLIHDEPNTEMTSFVWRETMLTHLLLWGNSYTQIIRNGRGAIIGLYPLLPDRMEVDRDQRGKLTYTYTNTEGQMTVLKPENVLHIPGLGFDGVVGYSPIAVERNAVGLSIAAEEYGSKFFSNGARPSGLLIHPNTVKEPDRLRQAWYSAFGGSTNSNKVAVLEENMRFEPLSMPNNEAQFLETRKFQIEEICRIYRVPPHLIADLEHATFSNIEHQNISFAVHTIRPWLVRIEQAMNRALFSEQEKGHYYVQFNIDGLMRGDYASRMQGYATARQNGWMSANDIRELENMNPLDEEEGGNVYMVNGNMLPIKYSLLAEKLQQLTLEAQQTQLDVLKEQTDMTVQQQELQLEQLKIDLENAKRNAELLKTQRENELEAEQYSLEEQKLSVEEQKLSLERQELELERAETEQEITESAKERVNEEIGNGEVLIVEEKGDEETE